jgi:hypothetical protein
MKYWHRNGKDVALDLLTVEVLGSGHNSQTQDAGEDSGPHFEGSTCLVYVG